jgi:hypothetical protein
VAYPGIELPDITDFLIIPVPIFFHVRYSFTELILPLFPIVVALYITIGLQESSAGVIDMFNLEMLPAASI